MPKRTTPQGTTKAEPKRGQRLDATRMIQWVERGDVYEAGVAIAEREHQKNQDAFSLLLRNAIALQPTLDEIKEHLSGTSLVSSLYEPSPTEVFGVVYQAVSKKTGVSVDAMTGTAAEPAKGKTRSVQWRERPEVVEEACRVAEQGGMTNRDAYSMLFRNGIVIDPVFRAVKRYLMEQREATLAELEASPVAWERREAAAQRLLRTLYEPSDLEAIQVIREAVQTAISGQADNEPDSEPDDEPDSGPNAEAGPAPLSLTVGEEMAASLDVISIRYGRHCVLVSNGEQQEYDLPEEQAEGRPVAEVALQGEVYYDIKADAIISLYKAPLNQKTREYDNLALVESRDTDQPPTSIIVSLPNGSFIVSGHGTTRVVDSVAADNVLPTVAGVTLGHNVIRIDGRRDAVDFLLR